MNTCIQTPESTVDAAQERLRSAGFHSRSLTEMGLPPTEVCANGDAAAVRFKVFGDLGGARLALLHPVSYLTDIDEPHFGIRLAAQQAVLEPEGVCVVGVQAFEPGIFDKNDRAKLRTGDFSPISQRVLRVGEHLVSGRQDRQVLPYGYSLGGDISIQVAYDVSFNPHRGSMHTVGVGSVEMARVQRRGGLKAAQAFNASSGQLLTNVCSSESPALNDAWGLRGGQLDTVQFQIRLGAGLLKYACKGLGDNRSIIAGFGSDASAVQAEKLLAKSDQQVFLGVEA